MMREIKTVIIIHTIAGMYIIGCFMVAVKFCQEGQILAASLEFLSFVLSVIANALYTANHLRQFRQLIIKLNGQSQ